MDEQPSRGRRGIVLAVVGICLLHRPSVGRDTVFIDGGELNGKRLDSSRPSIEVEAGAPIAGNLEVRIEASTTVPAIFTPTWGVPRHAYRVVSPAVEPGNGWLLHDVSVLAPAREGTYYLAVAAAPAGSPAHLASATAPDSPVDWRRTPPLSRLPPAAYEQAREDGWAPISWAGVGGAEDGEVGLAAVRVVVRGNVSSLGRISGSLNGSAVDPATSVTVAPGERISARLSVQAFGAHDGPEVSPCVLVWTWGEARTSWLEVSPSVAPGTSGLSVDIDLPPPPAQGTYFLALAMGPAGTSERLAAGCAASAEADWEAGNPLAGLYSGDYDTGTLEGWVPFSWHHPDGDLGGRLALTSFRVVVWDRLRVAVSGGSVNGASILPEDPELSVDPSTRLGGQLAISAHNSFEKSATVPVAITPTWGPPETSMQEVSADVDPGDTTLLGDVDLAVPEAPGTYYLAVAMSGSEKVEQLCSGTHPAYPADWRFGNVVARLPAESFELGIREGWIPFEWHTPEGPQAGILALGAVRVLVGLRGDADGDGSRTITDAVMILRHLFLGDRPPIHRRGGDVDGSRDTSVTDAVYLLDYLFLGGPDPAP